MSGEDRGRGASRWWVEAAAVVVAGFVLLRFWTRSQLWLDEAQTVDIARLPLAGIPGALRHDGSPPLYYFLLHFWMELVGTGNLAVRSLSGLFGLAAIPLAWLMGRDLGGRPAAAAAVVLVSANDFAVRYSTETRMYSLLILLGLLGYLALRSALARPSPLRLLAVGVVSGLSMLTHYWALYLVATVALGLAWQVLRAGPGPPRRQARLVLGALVAGLLLFAPWVPSFVYQLRHTGTPWAGRADLTYLGTVLTGFGGQGSRVGAILAVLFAALLVLGLFGAGGENWRVSLDLRIHPRARPLGWAALGTLLIALGASEVGGSGFSLRYAAVVFVPVFGLMARGVGVIGRADVRRGVLIAVAVLGALASYPNVTAQRTQAARAATDIRRYGHAGDVIAYCPDQLGPAMVRLLPSGRFRQVAYPRRGDPGLVDWADYARVNRDSRPAPFARSLISMAGPDHAVWLVWSPDYPTFEGKCDGLLNDLGSLRPGGQILFYENPRYFEHEELVVYRRH